jgi:hypothetical protein
MGRLCVLERERSRLRCGEGLEIALQVSSSTLGFAHQALRQPPGRREAQLCQGLEEQCQRVLQASGSVQRLCPAVQQLGRVPAQHLMGFALRSEVLRPPSRKSASHQVPCQAARALQLICLTHPVNKKMDVTQMTITFALQAEIAGAHT